MPVKWFHREVLKKITASVESAAEETGEFISQEARVKIETGPKSGRIYRRYNPYRIVQASAPGQPPALDTGDLSNSIHPQQNVKNTTQIVKRISATSDHAAPMELGTPKIAPRPYLRPSVFENETEILDILRKELKK